MKKLVLTIGCALAAAGVAFAQGSVQWSTIPFGSMTAQTNATLISPLFGGASTSGNTAYGTTIGNAGGVANAGTGFYYELLYQGGASEVTAPTSLAQLLSWSDAGLSASNSTTAGKLSPMTPNAGAVVPWSPGTTDSIVLVGWSSSLGSSWSAVDALLQSSSTFAPNSYFGVTSSGYITTLASSVAPGSAVFGAPTIEGTPIVSLATQLYALPVPEPATMALSGLGGLALLLIRRRK